MSFQSILGERKLEYIEEENIRMPKFFADLNLDQIVQDIMEEKKDYNLQRYFYFKAEGTDTIQYRLEVLRDLEKEQLKEAVLNFTIGMRKAKKYINYSQDIKHELQQQKWNLDGADCYIKSILKFQRDIQELPINSKGFQTLRIWLEEYINSAEFNKLKDGTDRLVQQFKQMKYHILIKQDRVIITQDYVEKDYCKQLLDTFKEEITEDNYYQKNPFGSMNLSALEEAVLDVLLKPYKETFRELDEYYKHNQGFINEVLDNLEQEVQFYLSFLLYKERMESMKFHFCYPEISNTVDFRILEGYDLALAKKNGALNKEVVFNDGYYQPEERFFVITGPNQGGKTTFARALGQIVYFGSLGLMVPCRSASFPPFDGIYTHFAVEENMETGAGKLKEELMRLKIMKELVTKNSFVIINEIFTSATSYDAYIMGKRVIDYFMDLDCLGVYVTHIYELTKNDDRVVSLVATLLSEDSNIRTFRIERKEADGKSYANTIVQKYQMTYQEIKERLNK